MYREKNRNYTVIYTGELHPNEVADPAIANIALIDSPAPHIPKSRNLRIEMLDNENNK